VKLKPLLRLEALTVTGRTLGEENRTGRRELRAETSCGGFAQSNLSGRVASAVLRGNLAPGGAIIKQSAADAKLMEHEGRAVVFENAEDLVARIDSD